MVVVGHSAGAQLAALAALVGDRYQAGCSSPYVPVDGLVGLAGPYDLVALGERAAPLFSSSRPDEDPETWRAASPSYQVAERPDLPVLLLHGEADDVIPPSTSEDFAAALEAAGHSVTLDVLPEPEPLPGGRRRGGCRTDRGVRRVAGLLDPPDRSHAAVRPSHYRRSMADDDTPWEPPLAGTEVEQLLGALNRLRTTFRWKADGLDAAGAADHRRRLHADPGRAAQAPGVARGLHVHGQAARRADRRALGRARRRRQHGLGVHVGRR